MGKLIYASNMSLDEHRFSNGVVHLRYRLS